MNQAEDITFSHSKERQLVGSHHFYGVEVTYYASIEKKIQYVLDLAYIESLGNDYKVRINRGQFFIDGMQPNRLLDELAEKCMSCIYPIDFQMNPLSGLIGVLNYEEIKERWQDSLTKLKREFSGEFALQYFNQITDSLEQEATFFNSLRNDILYDFLFVKIEALQERNHIRKEMSYEVSIDPYKEPILFYGNQRIHFDDRGTGTMLVKYKGKDKNKNTLKLSHYLDKVNYMIQKAEGLYTSFQKDKKISFKLTLLKEKSKEYVEKKETSEATPPEVMKKKSSWFSNFFKSAKKYRYE